MSTSEVIFFIGIFIIFYSYIGYGLLLWVILKLRGSRRQSKAIPDPEFLPPVTLIVAAYNEERFIEEKIRNTLSLDYPEDKLRIIFITDGSSDATPALISRYARIQLLHRPARLGKVVAMHRAMSFVDTPLVIFSDANTLLNRESIRNIVRHYKDPLTGGVAGEKKIMATGTEEVAGAGEGMYWKYESFLKKLDAAFYSVVGAAGELFSVRTELYEYAGDNVLLDDFIISLRVCRKGYRVAYEPDAFASETPSSSIKEERKRKIRISAGAFQSMFMLRDLLNVFRYPKLSFQYISHRVLRWTLCPLLLPIVFILNVWLAWNTGSPVYLLTLGAQAAFYLSALAGWILSVYKVRISYLYAAYYFVFINLSLYIGFFRFLNGRQTVLWDKAVRKTYDAKLSPRENNS